MSWHHIFILITNALTNTGEPVFQLIELETKSANENKNDEMSFRCLCTGCYSAAALNGSILAWLSAWQTLDNSTHLGKDAFGGGLYWFVLQENARWNGHWIKLFLGIHQSNNQCLKWTLVSSGYISPQLIPLFQWCQFDGSNGLTNDLDYHTALTYKAYMRYFIGILAIVSSVAACDYARNYCWWCSNYKQFTNILDDPQLPLHTLLTYLFELDLRRQCHSLGHDTIWLNSLDCSRNSAILFILLVATFFLQMKSAK